MSLNDAVGLAMNDDLSRLLDDKAVYLRTAAGQAALLSSTNLLSHLERRFLGAVTGYTSLRVLLNLGFDGPGIGIAISRLSGLRLIVAVGA
jgi:hypothetical protein